ncbi:MAG: hypothetical protein A3G34_13220 [Candidatus Lindowbacteria bacterium RIFCSPLOWO2_12_FULL_62_27]|nr:MAG: hypothetical protein A3I06_14840 [Candidatus Lindowbacteria bacterium RIFCSPLOWO2_02_FULL_62_12]OGH62544.1 MAG: hypothetical protein A3G34_13220 [Candidatus Lindowbacteria bacterium RIFCSPLOWO2_12_FULL_62_27]
MDWLFGKTSLGAMLPGLTTFRCAGSPVHGAGASGRFTGTFTITFPTDRMNLLHEVVGSNLNVNLHVPVNVPELGALMNGDGSEEVLSPQARGIKEGVTWRR